MNNPTIGAMRLLAFLAMTCLLIIGGTQPASANTYDVTDSQCTGGAWTLEGAVQQANANPGPDIINIHGGLEINGDSCSVNYATFPDPINYYMLTVTDSLTIEGNGARVVGHMSWMDRAGNLNGHSMCPWRLPEVIVMNIPPGFIKVGKSRDATANAGLTVTVKNLNINQLNSIARVNDGASLTLDNVNASDIWSVYHGCGDAALIGQNDVRVTIKNSRWEGILTWAAYILPEVPGETIEAESGSLNIENSKFFNLDTAAVSWSGTATDKVNIVSTEIFNSGGIVVSGDVTTNFVNSLFYSDPMSEPGRMDQRFVNVSSGPMNLVGSTFLFLEAQCNPYCQGFGSPGYFYSTLPGGAINFRQSAVGVGWPATAAGLELLMALSVNPNIFSADQYTFIQSDDFSNTTAHLRDLTHQPLLLTSGAAFSTDPPNLVAGNWAMPLSPGVLIGAVPNAGRGGANELINPIDNLPILLDVFGNPRVDTNDNTRNIGALQLSPTPVLFLDTVGNGVADLSWTYPPDPAQPIGPITGYAVYWHRKGATGPWNNWSNNDPTWLSARINSLDNGVRYEFMVAARDANGNDLPTSNVVETLIGGVPGAPSPLTGVGTPLRHQQVLNWVAAPDNGIPLTGYVIVYRPLGGTAWTPWPFTGTGTTATVTGLTAGTNYEFKVAGMNGIGAGPYSNIQTGPYLPCDTNGSGTVNKTDIALINVARNTAAVAGDVRDQNHNGVIDLYDSRQCTLLCTKPLCAL